MINHLSNAWNFRLGWFVCLEVPVGLVYPFCLALGKKEIYFFFCASGAYLGSDGACLGSDGLLPNGLSTYLGQPKDLELGKDTWKEASHNDL